MNGETIMDLYTETLNEYLVFKCPYCGEKLEVFETDDMDCIICPECSNTWNIAELGEPINE